MDSRRASNEDLIIQKKCPSPAQTSKQQERPGDFQTCRWRFSLREIILFVVIAILLLVISVLSRFVGDGSPGIPGKQTEKMGHSLVSPPQFGPPCPRYWIGYEGKCYYFSREKRDWASSHHYCSSHNASLARIEKEEMDFVIRLKGKDICWIGLQNILNVWTWTDGENATMEVSGGGDCAYLDNTAIGSGCHTKLPCICSKPAAYSTKAVAD